MQDIRKAFSPLKTKPDLKTALTTNVKQRKTAITTQSINKRFRRKPAKQQYPSFDEGLTIRLLYVPIDSSSSGADRSLSLHLASQASSFTTYILAALLAITNAKFE